MKSILLTSVLLIGCGNVAATEVTTLCEDGFTFKVFPTNTVQVKGEDGMPIICGGRLAKRMAQIEAQEMMMKAYLEQMSKSWSKIAGTRGETEAHLKVYKAIEKADRKVEWCKDNVEACRKCEDNFKTCEGWNNELN